MHGSLSSPAQSSSSPSATQMTGGTDTAPAVGLAIAGVMLFAVVLTLALAWAAKVRRARRRPPRDPTKPFAEP